MKKEWMNGCFNSRRVGTENGALRGTADANPHGFKVVRGTGFWHRLAGLCVRAFFVAALFVALPLFAGAKKDTRAKAIGTLVIGSTMGIERVNPEDYYYDVFSGTITKMALISVDENGVFKPQLAEFSTNDSKSWRFTVRPGINWHDGVPVTAGDVRYTLLQGENAANIYDRITVTDSRTVDVVLKTANARYLSSITTTRILPSHIFEGKEIASVGEAEAAIGCGPYRFVRFDRNAGVLEFQAWTGYYRGKPNVETVVLRLFGNEDTLVMALKTGEIDMAYYYAAGVGTAYQEDLRKDSRITLMPVRDTSNTCVLVFNNSLTPFTVQDIRFAVAKAVDYDRFRALFGSPYAVPATEGFVPVGTIGYVPMPTMKRDLAASRSYLEKAGARDTDGDGIVELDGKPLVISIHVRSDRAEYERYGELLKANLAEAGIGVNLILQEVAVFRDITEKQHTNQAMITKFTAYGMAAQAGMGSLYLDGRLSVNAQGQIKDPAYAAIVDRLAAAVTQEAYAQAAKDCQEYYAKTMSAVAIFWDSYVQAHRTGLSGFTVDGTFGILNMDTWFSLTSAP
jgi:peptide/nickel transport system substrate-binding protein